MLAINSVVVHPASDDGPEQRFVVLWIGAGDAESWWIDLEDPKAHPLPFSRKQVEADLDDGTCTSGKPNYPHTGRLVSEKERDARDARWNAIREAVEDEPRVFDPLKRSALYREAAERGGFTLNTSRKLFRMFWQGGKTSAALVPAFGERGGVGVLREPGDKKLGRPRRHVLEFSGLNLSRHQKRAVASFARAQIRRNGKTLLTTCYHLWLDRLFFEDGFDDAGKPARVPRPEFKTTGLPTKEQFQRIYYSLTDVIEAKRLRDPRRFALNFRPLEGTATAETWGPGSRFLIDATVADIYLVARCDRNRIVGRPVVYIVIDVWSRLIIGLYVAIEDASWTSATMALANAACSKVEFCAAHGIEIEEDDWPAGNIGARLLSDKGEVDTGTAANLALHFNRTVEAAASYRGDLKGLVETQFNTVQVQFGQFTPGYVDKDFKKRGGRDYRLDAVFDIDEFTTTIIDLVLARNADTLAKYDRDQGMPGGVVKLAPIQLWHWGMQHRSGRSQAWPEEYVRFRLLPVAEASVDRNGISFQGRSYVGPSVRRLMSKARMGESGTVTISFDPRVVDAVYLHVPEAEHGFEVCELHLASRAYAGLTCVEADQDRQLVAAAKRDAGTADATRKVNVNDRMQRRVEAAEAKKVPDPHTTLKEKVGSIRENRRAEKERTRAEHGEAFRPAPAPERSEAEVILLRPPVAVDDLSESKLNDFLGD